MDGKEKVIKGLEICSTGHCEISCPYHNTPQCTWTILSDALELLKEQQELVLCKDCKYYDSFSQECRNGIDGIMTPNFYCGNAERKEGW